MKRIVACESFFQLLLQEHSGRMVLLHVLLPLLDAERMVYVEDTHQEEGGEELDDVAAV